MLDVKYMFPSHTFPNVDPTEIYKQTNQTNENSQLTMFNARLDLYQACLTRCIMYLIICRGCFGCMLAYLCEHSPGKVW